MIVRASVIYSPEPEEYPVSPAQGPALGGRSGAGRVDQVDCGAMCMPGLAEKVQELVDDAVAKGAKVRP